MMDVSHRHRTLGVTLAHVQVFKKRNISTAVAGVTLSQVQVLKKCYISTHVEGVT